MICITPIMTADTNCKCHSNHHCRYSKYSIPKQKKETILQTKKDNQMCFIVYTLPPIIIV